MRKFPLLCSLIIASALAGAPDAKAAEPQYTPTAENLQARSEFAEARFGIFIHWGIYSMLGDGEWVQNIKGIPYDEYSHLAAGFCPSRFDAAEWARIFREAGAKYVTFTSRHHDGFAMFKSEASDYNIVDRTPFRRDVVKELAEAVRGEGMKLHLYYSQLDWGRSDYTPIGSTGNMPRDGRKGDWSDYMAFMDAQLTELLTNYGPIGCIWFDGAWDKETEREEWARLWNFDGQYALIHRLQPSCLVGSNHHKTPWPGEDIQIFERDVPGQNTAGYCKGQEVSTSLPLETCQTINGPWGYKIGRNDCKSLQYLIQLLARTAAKDANLLLNVGPRPDGTLPEDAVARLLEMGDWLKINGESIYSTHGALLPEQDWGVATYKGNKLYLHIFNADSPVSLTAEGNKALSAATLDGSRGVTWSQKKSDITITPERQEDAIIDNVIVVTFKKPVTPGTINCIKQKSE